MLSGLVRVWLFVVRLSERWVLGDESSARGPSTPNSLGKARPKCSRGLASKSSRKILPVHAFHKEGGLFAYLLIK